MHTHTPEYYSAIKIYTLPFAAIWMDLNDERNKSEKDKYSVISLICRI